MYKRIKRSKLPPISSSPHVFAQSEASERPERSKTFVGALDWAFFSDEVASYIQSLNPQKFLETRGEIYAAVLEHPLFVDSFQSRTIFKCH
jgi:hypothetical protein